MVLSNNFSKLAPKIFVRKTIPFRYFLTQKASWFCVMLIQYDLLVDSYLVYDAVNGAFLIKKWK